MGEVAHGTGRTVGRGLNMSNRALGNVGLGNRSLGNISYRLGRATNPEENISSPFQSGRPKRTRWHIRR
jgi:hypothetical protein